MQPEDHFSTAADHYKQFRPDYPAELFDWLQSQNNSSQPRTWDVGCGSGQASIAMAQRGWRVVASDLSVEQLKQAPRHRNIRYLAATSEQCPLANNSMQLITVAQAAHWFNLPAFYSEAERVLEPGGLLALWGYERPALQHNSLAAAFHDFHAHWLRPWWPEQRQLVDNGYRDLFFPYQKLTPPTLAITRQWSLSELLGYAASWSATQRCTQTGGQPIAELSARLASDWPLNGHGKPAAVAVHWPMFILATTMTA